MRSIVVWLQWRGVFDPFVTKSRIQDVLPLPGFCFFTIMEIVFASDNRRNSKKMGKLLKMKLFLCVLRGGYGVVKKSQIFEKVKTQVTMVTKIMFFFLDNYHFDIRRKRVFAKK